MYTYSLGIRGGNYLSTLNYICSFLINLYPLFKKRKVIECQI